MTVMTVFGLGDLGMQGVLLDWAWDRLGWVI